MPRRYHTVRRAARPRLHWLVLAVSLASCSERATDTGEALSGRVGLVAIYPAGASVVTAILPIDAAHVRITRPPATVLLDSTVAFPAAADQIALDLRLALASRVERLAVRLELSGGGTLLFAGEDTVEVRAEGTGPPAAPQIQLAYVGPGANVAFLVLEPRDTTLSLGASFDFRVSAFDASEQSVGQFYAGWSTDDPAVRVSPTGTIAGPSVRRQLRLRVKSANGVADSTTVWFSPPATSIVIADGDGQTGPSGGALATPLTVQVRAADNLGVSGVTVQFTGLNGATVQDPTVITDGNGNASTVGILGPALGPQQFEATAPGLIPVRFAATAVIGPPAQLFVVSGSGQTGSAGAPLPAPLVVGAVDQGQHPTPNVTIDWTVTNGGGTVSEASTVTDAQGHAQVDYTLGPQAGPNTIVASARSSSAPPATFTVTTAPARPSRLILVGGGGQSVTAGTISPTPLEVEVRDSLDNLVPGATVAWQVLGGGSGLTSFSTTTDAQGRTQTGFFAGPNAVVNRVRVAIVGGPPGSNYNVPVVVVPDTAARFGFFSGNWQSVAGSATSRPLIVVVTDQYGNGVAGVPITWAFTPAGSLSATSTQTDANGVTLITYTAPASPPPAFVIAKRNAKDSLRFTINDPSSTQLFVAGGDNQGGPGGSTLPQPLTAIVTDVGQPVANFPVGFQVALGGATILTSSGSTDANGLATATVQLATRAGPNVFQASAFGRVVEFGETGIAGPPTSILPFAGDFPTGALSQGFAPTLTVVVIDANGNPVAGAQVDWSDQNGGSESPATSTTDARGLASTTYTPTQAGRQKVRATLAATQTPIEFVVTVNP